MKKLILFSFLIHSSVLFSSDGQRQSNKVFTQKRIQPVHSQLTLLLHDTLENITNYEHIHKEKRYINIESDDERRSPTCPYYIIVNYGDNDYRMGVRDKIVTIVEIIRDLKLLHGIKINSECNNLRIIAPCHSNYINPYENAYQFRKIILERSR